MVLVERKQNPNPQNQMNKSTRTILMAAAVAGLYAGSFAVKALADEAGKTAPAGEKAKSSCSGKDGCKGKNSCKGKGGCAAAHEEKK